MAPQMMNMSKLVMHYEEMLVEAYNHMIHVHGEQLTTLDFQGMFAVTARFNGFIAASHDSIGVDPELMKRLAVENYDLGFKDHIEAAGTEAARNRANIMLDRIVANQGKDPNPEA